MTRFPSNGLYAIADTGNKECDLVAFSRAVLAGGAAILQYRAKTSVCIKTAGQIRDLCRLYAVPFIVNDDVDMAEQLEADGVHLGGNDDDCRRVRDRFSNTQMIIGVSCYNVLSSALAAIQAGADYVSFGAFYPSPSKPDAVHAPLELLQQAKEVIGKPIVAIGGIHPDNAPALLEAGTDFIAVISDLMNNPDPEKRARLYNRLFDRRTDE